MNPPFAVIAEPELAFPSVLDAAASGPRAWRTRSNWCRRSGGPLMAPNSGQRPRGLPHGIPGGGREYQDPWFARSGVGLGNRQPMSSPAETHANTPDSGCDSLGHESARVRSPTIRFSKFRSGAHTAEFAQFVARGGTRFGERLSGHNRSTDKAFVATPKPHPAMPFIDRSYLMPTRYGAAAPRTTQKQTQSGTADTSRDILVHVQRQVRAKSKLHAQY
jgi:hypothetical protein